MITEDSDGITLHDLFYNMMINHPTVIANISIDEFCINIYQSLTNCTVTVDLGKLPMTEEERVVIFQRLLTHGANQLDVSLSFRGAARLVATLRNELIGSNEGYMDWYCSGNECYLAPIIGEIYDEYNIKWTSTY